MQRVHHRQRRKNRHASNQIVRLRTILPPQRDPSPHIKDIPQPAPAARFVLPAPRPRRKNPPPSSPPPPPQSPRLRQSAASKPRGRPDTQPAHPDEKLSARDSQSDPPTPAAREIS